MLVTVVGRPRASIAAPVEGYEALPRIRFNVEQKVELLTTNVVASMKEGLTALVEQPDVDVQIALFPSGLLWAAEGEHKRTQITVQEAAVVRRRRSLPLWIFKLRHYLRTGTVSGPIHDHKTEAD